VGSLTAVPSSISLTVGGRAVGFKVLDSQLNAVNASLSYKSADETIATVDAGGNVSPVKAGTTTVTASDANGDTVDVPVTVS
jgi:uncharacterized protein YjdB